MIFFKNNFEKATSIFFLVFFIPIILYADTDTCLPGQICNPIPNVTSIGGLIQTLLTGILRIGIPIIALAIIYCGFLFVKAQGKPEELKKAKDALLYTLIGAAILLGSWALAQFISNTVFAL